MGWYTMGKSFRTFLQWYEENNKSGRIASDRKPFDMERYYLECGKKICTATKIFNIGDTICNRTVTDVRIVEKSDSKHAEVLLRCNKCGDKHWYDTKIAEKISASCCPHCQQGNLNNLTHFRKFYPDYAIGTKVGELTVLENGVQEHKTRSGKIRKDRVVKVQCSCGAEPYWVLFSNLHSGKTTRCNKCAKIKAHATQNKPYEFARELVPDDETRRRLMGRINSCFERCNCKTYRLYKHYGARGIKVEFKDRYEFLQYLVTLPGYDDPYKTLDRIDNDGNYAKGNLRFVSFTVQNNNKRTVYDLQQEVDRLRQQVAELQAELNKYKN